MPQPDNASSQSGSGEPLVSSGVASPDLIAAVTAASSAADEPAVPAGDTTQQTGEEGDPGANADATSQPAGDEPPAGSQPASDGIPENRIQAAVRNAREKAIQEVRQQYAAFEGMDPEQVTLGLQLLQEIQADPAKFYQELGQRISSGQPEEDEPYPEADLRSKENPNLRTYSEGTFQKALEIHGRKVMRQVMKDLKPFIDFTHSQQAEAQSRAQLEARTKVVNEALAEARQLPHFTKENEPAILDALRAIPADKRKAMGPVASLYLAYNNFLKANVFPSIQAQAEKNVRANLVKKQNAGAGSVHPVDQEGSQAPKLRNEQDLAAHMARMAGTTA